MRSRRRWKQRSSVVVPWNNPHPAALDFVKNAKIEVPVTADAIEQSRQRLERIESALEAQRTYIRRVQDPDNRYRAETNLLTLLEMKAASQVSHHALVERQDGSPAH